MEKWSFGVTMLVLGMGGTLLTLWILSLLMVLLKRAFPLSLEDNASEKATKGRR